MNKITNIASLLMLTVQAAMCLVACGHAGVSVGDMSWLFAVSVSAHAAISFFRKASAVLQLSAQLSQSRQSRAAARPPYRYTETDYRHDAHALLS